MKHLRLLILLNLFFMSFSTAWAGFDEGIEYQRLKNPVSTSDPAKIEVVELFWYGCPHCFHFEPDLKSWLEKKSDNVVFVRVPAVFNKRWAFHAKVYYTAEVLGVLDKMHPIIFEDIHVKHKKLASVNEVRALFVANGVSEQDFNNAFNSFAVDAKLRRATDLSKRYGISGVPALVINGKYVTDGPMANGRQGMLKITDYLINKEATAGK